jgi:DNA polymerase-3 subunit delta'
MADSVETGFLSVGQAAARTIVRRAAERGRLQLTLLIHGAPGSGADRFVDDLLALLFCERVDAAARPCNACAGCRGARSRSHPDLVIGSPDRWRELKGSGESVVAAARRWLAESAGAPVVAERRILLVEHVDRAGDQIQNALLKALEEPGPRQMFILVADDLSAVLPTIRSRCQPLRLGPVRRDELSAWLVDHEHLPADQADLLARLASGRSGTAVAMARDPDLIAWRRRAQLQLLGLLDGGVADRFGALKDLLEDATRRAGAVAGSGIDVSPADGATRPEGAGEADEPVRTPASQQRAGSMLLVDAWGELARDLLVIAGDQPELAAAAEVLEGAPAAARRVGQRSLAVFLRRLERVREGLEANAAPRLAMEVAMLAWPRAQAPAAPARAGAATTGYASASGVG